MNTLEDIVGVVFIFAGLTVLLMIAQQIGESRIQFGSLPFTFVPPTGLSLVGFVVKSLGFKLTMTKLDVINHDALIADQLFL